MSIDDFARFLGYSILITSGVLCLFALLWMLYSYVLNKLCRGEEMLEVCFEIQRRRRAKKKDKEPDAQRQKAEQV